MEEWAETIKAVKPKLYKFQKEALKRTLETSGFRDREIDLDSFSPTETDIYIILSRANPKPLKFMFEIYKHCAESSDIGVE